MGQMMPSGLHPDVTGLDPLGGGEGATIREVTVDPNDASNSTTIATTFADGGIFEADNFGRIANGGNSIPYNGQSMWEMSFISFAQAGQTWVPFLDDPDKPGDFILGGTFLRSEFTPSTNMGFSRWSADKIEKMSIEDFEKNYRRAGQTVVDNPMNNAQSFKILTVLIDNKQPTDAEFDLVAEHTAWFALNADDGDNNIFNFHEATNFLGTLVAGPLDLDLK